MSKFQFRKRLKLAPGLSLNVSKKGLGLSAGPKGLKTSISAQGRITGSAGIPGSGISYRKTLSGSRGPVEDTSVVTTNFASKMEYISIHGAVFKKGELKRTYVIFCLLYSSLITSLLLFAMQSGIIFVKVSILLSATSYALTIILFVLGFIEQSKNRRIWDERIQEHLEVCDLFGLEGLTAEVKKCPMCAEDVKFAAKKCRYCQHLFDI
jgi:hypothetical protein